MTGILPCTFLTIILPILISGEAIIVKHTTQPSLAQVNSNRINQNVGQLVSVGWKSAEGYFDACYGTLVDIENMKIVITSVTCAEQVNKYTTDEAKRYVMSNDGTTVSIENILMQQDSQIANNGGIKQDDIAVVILGQLDDPNKKLPKGVNPPDKSEAVKKTNRGIFNLLQYFMKWDEPLMTLDRLEGSKDYALISKPGLILASENCAELIKAIPELKWRETGWLCIASEQDEYVPIGSSYIKDNTLNGVYSSNFLISLLPSLSPPLTKLIADGYTHVYFYTNLITYVDWIKENVEKPEMMKTIWKL